MRALLAPFLFHPLVGLLPLLFSFLEVSPSVVSMWVHVSMPMVAPVLPLFFHFLKEAHSSEGVGKHDRKETECQRPHDDIINILGVL